MFVPKSSTNIIKNADIVGMKAEKNPLGRKKGRLRAWKKPCSTFATRLFLFSAVR